MAFIIVRITVPGRKWKVGHLINVKTSSVPSKIILFILVLSINGSYLYLASFLIDCVQKFNLWITIILNKWLINLNYFFKNKLINKNAVIGLCGVVCLVGFHENGLKICVFYFSEGYI